MKIFLKPIIILLSNKKGVNFRKIAKNTEGACFGKQAPQYF